MANNELQHFNNRPENKQERINVDNRLELILNAFRAVVLSILCYLEFSCLEMTNGSKNYKDSQFALSLLYLFMIKLATILAEKYFRFKSLIYTLSSVTSNNQAIQLLKQLRRAIK